MHIHKTAIPVLGDDIVPRFDLATEVIVLHTADKTNLQEKRSIVLPRSSADELCHILLSENINTVICGAIEDEYYEFLKWKEIEVYDAVSGAWTHAFERWQTQTLTAGDILSMRMIEGELI
ncbi:MAG: hypothetical protein MI892_29010 [Desulfobacterales bacterium]|nr:hypothetical protein [Desulfobacterales bacterium]